MKKIFFALGLAALSVSNASACSCGFASLDQQVNAADHIFIATLQSAKLVPGDYPEKWPSIEGSFLVKRSLKGNVAQSEVVLRTGLGRGDCGVFMTVSMKYVIFKQKNDTGIGGCSGTSAIEDFQEDEIAGKIQAILSQRKRKAQK
jgi:hypothetical protein